MSRPKRRSTRVRGQADRRSAAGAGSGFAELSARLAEIGRDFYRRGWCLGTSGNFSAVVSREPLRLAITSTGLDKGALARGQFLEIDGAGAVLRGRGQPSSETGIHLAIVRQRGAGAVLHTHSVWSTILSEVFAAERGMTLQGYEMLKGLSGVRTHEHSEWLPVLENSQNMTAMAESVEAALGRSPAAHGFLLLRHGLYTWGEDLGEAKRHVEIFEFLLEAAGRARSLAG